MNSTSKRITVVIPSLNQGRYLDEALASIDRQNLPVEIVLVDGGSTDETQDVIRKWQAKLAWWRSEKDAGQAAAINEGMGRGSAPYVCWLNADDTYLQGGLRRMLDYLETHPDVAAVYGRTWNTDRHGGSRRAYWTAEFSAWRLAQYCFISQPATLIRREAWDAVAGLDESRSMAMDYDLWWKLYRKFGKLGYLNEFVATNRTHGATKTNTQRRRHYAEAMAIVKKHTGSVPLKWYLAWPFSVWLRERLVRQKYPLGQRSIESHE